MTTDPDYRDRLVDEDALASYLRAEFGPADAFSVERHAAGHSNETLFVAWGDRDLVIRRPPPGETADTAHDVLREHRVVDALGDTDVPVPRTLRACDDHGVLGSDFYVMERTAGDVLRDDEPDRFADPAARERVGTELVDALAAIHDVDYAAVGLAEFGRPAGYTARQVDRWTAQLDWAFEATEAVRAVPELVELGEWLAANAPDDHPDALVHGDFKLDNAMYGPGTPPEIVAVFDWELSTLGDPLADLGWLLLFWHDAGDPTPAMPELMPTFTARAGYPTRGELVDRYESATGRSFRRERFYRALAAYKMAALGEMFLARHLRGDADDPLYPTMESAVPALAERALAYVEGETDRL
ncbi:phosphotransferase family protein [Halorubrum lipolyticum]|uniref:Aminoglycoside phosphotransferase n=1 Tax=Halorubrum lipolyticum DSM 21995 TaxID=1227482 RepID=M0NQI8_9EURY|nr:phosphotransferase family protein [Halorubrum lipolyticum]EMA60202.1 aminoglycoside phosphotransferase [Halorubrum lipolyticum DSM 21995]